MNPVEQLWHLFFMVVVAIIVYGYREFNWLENPNYSLIYTIIVSKLSTNIILVIKLNKCSK